MPQHKSCKKRMKTAANARQRNRSEKSEMKKLIRELRDCKTKSEADSKLAGVFSRIDIAARHNTIHKNKAARDKSRLMAHLKKLGG